MNLDLQHHTQMYLGLYERELHPWIARLASRSKTLIDVGAGEGYYTLYFLGLKTSARVMSFEPDALPMKQLLLNLALNGFQSDERRLLLSESRVTRHIGNGSLTLDGLEADLIPPCIIKMDVEGGELDVLRGARALLRRKDVSWVVEIHSAALEAGCLEIFERNGLTVKVIRPAWWRLVVPEMRPLPVNHWILASFEPLILRH